MNAVGAAVRKVSQTVGGAATATTMAAGAVGGAAVNGVIGAVSGTVTGVQRGVSTGSHSTPAAALTLGAIGVSGLVEWPLVLAVGGGAFVLRQLNRSDKAVTEPASTAPAKLTSVSSTGSKPAAKTSRPKPRRSAPAKATARR